MLPGTAVKPLMLLAHVLELINHISVVLYLYESYAQAGRSAGAPDLFWAAFASFGAMCMWADLCHHFGMTNWILHWWLQNQWEKIDDASNFYGNCCLGCCFVPFAYLLGHCCIIISLVIGLHGGPASALSLLCAGEFLLCHGFALLPYSECCNPTPPMDERGLADAQNIRVSSCFFVPILGAITLFRRDVHAIKRLQSKYVWDKIGRVLLGDIPFIVIAVRDLEIHGGSYFATSKLILSALQVALIVIMSTVPLCSKDEPPATTVAAAPSAATLPPLAETMPESVGTVSL
ncbi:unnamed protein product [Durusdinium trenchii]|uniref:Uncharacterized protein n=1 Tax=Durusdinium trenchii TaxID=1381693 RepID=A0ABP0HHI5_9DINO